MSSPLADEVKRAARGLGLDLVGITTVTPPDHATAFQQWLADGFHGELGYVARNAAKRVDPQAVLPGARSIVVVGMNYWTGDHQDVRGEAVRDPSTPLRSAQDDKLVAARPAGDDGGRGGRPPEGCHPERSRGISSAAVTGRVACYAWGTADYHDLIGERLKQLAAHIIKLGDLDLRHSGTQAPSHSNTQALWYVDTGPVLERDLAHR
ncbi:DUF1730 domain-containing protein, partial [bacterium]|nr:DUF1730 domain-containing protein [bacterium]